ncbi:unnamed protein product [Urochloa humidicola]
MGKNSLAPATLVVLFVGLVAGDLGGQVSGNKIKSLSTFPSGADPSTSSVYPHLLLHRCPRDPVHFPASILDFASKVALSGSDPAIGAVDLVVCAADSVTPLLLWSSYPASDRDALHLSLHSPIAVTTTFISACTTSSLKLNNNSLLSASPTATAAAIFSLEEDAQEHSTDKFNKIFDSVEMKTPVDFLGPSNRRSARSLLTICLSSPPVCLLTGAPHRDPIVILSSEEDFCVIWLL